MSKAKEIRAKTLGAVVSGTDQLTIDSQDLDYLVSRARALEKIYDAQLSLYAGTFHGRNLAEEIERILHGVEGDIWEQNIP